VSETDQGVGRPTVGILEGLRNDDAPGSLSICSRFSFFPQKSTDGVPVDNCRGDNTRVLELYPTVFVLYS